MRLATGTLKNGTYCGHAVIRPGQFHAIHDDGVQLEMTDDKADDGIKWKVKHLGGYKYTMQNKVSGKSITHDPDIGVEVQVVEGEVEWIIKPTEVPGEYIVAPASSPSMFAAASVETVVAFTPEAESPLTRFKVYVFDDE